MSKVGEKSTRATTRIRITAVMELLLKGRTRGHIVEYCADYWDIGERQADEYIAAASKEIEELNEASAERNLALITSNLWDLYRKSVDCPKKEKNTSFARQLLLDIAKLRGLDKEEINFNFTRRNASASEDELAAALGKKVAE